MDKGLTVSIKMGADKSAEIPEIPQNLSAQIVCRSPKVWDSMKKDFMAVHSPWWQ